MDEMDGEDGGHNGDRLTLYLCSYEHVTWSFNAWR